MPRGSRSDYKSGQKIHVPFHAVVNGSVASNVGSLALQNGQLVATTVNLVGAENLANIATMYTFFKCIALKFRTYYIESAGTGIQYAAGFVNTGGGTSSPASLGDVITLKYSQYSDNLDKFRRPFVTVPLKELQGQFPKYRVSSSVDASEFVQGLIQIYSGNATDVVRLELIGLMEYSDPVDSTLAISKLKSALRQEVLGELTEGFQSSVRSSSIPNLPGKK